MTKAEGSKAFNDYKTELFKEAERIVMEEFPKKVIEYDNMLKTNRFSYARLPEMMPDPDLNIPVPSVTHLVKMWITLLIPRIEDGNNFGVSIQEETLSEVRNVESEAASFLDQMSRYFTSRAKLLTKVAKYPHVDDYRRAILDMDEKQFINNIEKIKKPRNSNMEMLY
ncbi:unnamed protein product [Nippostrongylus brasiliensis]|uniref:Proteasome activator PA28-gamma (inferred by orthology to a S. mansoni protein) n=1 Tax=Nippostrongylus brasiliensis TaxID=27835 RepID=A0A0N4YL87_NIPBR|nr:unnamed protein product [Nippostrongylus brasiliensis]